MTNRPAYSAPIVNLNGSSPQTMVVDILAALDALRVAIDAVGQTAPHPRDWQTVSDGERQFALAREQHLARMEGLRLTYAELEAIGVSIQEQADRRGRP